MAPSAQLVEFVNFELAIAAGPYRYNQGGGRCDPIHSGYSDCSGLVCASLANLGVDSIGCTGSFLLARACHAAGTGIPLAQARVTRGALLFIGINEGQGGIPGVDEGHVATSCGDGTAVQALNTNAGIGIWPFEMLSWSWAGMPCWFPLTATDPPPPPPPPPPTRKREVPMLFRVPRTAHSVSDDADGNLILLGGAQAVALHDYHTGGPVHLGPYWIIPSQKGPYDYRGATAGQEGTNFVLRQSFQHTETGSVVDRIYVLR